MSSSDLCRPSFEQKSMALIQWRHMTCLLDWTWCSHSARPDGYSLLDFLHQTLRPCRCFRKKFPKSGCISGLRVLVAVSFGMLPVSSPYWTAKRIEKDIIGWKAKAGIVEKDIWVMTRLFRAFLVDLRVLLPREFTSKMEFDSHVQVDRYGGKFISRRNYDSSGVATNPAIWS